MTEDVKLDDSGAGMSVMARLKLVRELSQIKADIAAAGTGPMAALKRLKLTAKANEIRAKLGGAALAPKPDPAVGENSNVTMLREVAAGKHDAEGLEALYERINGAAKALEVAGLLIGDAEAAAQDAITHWAELEVRLNGDA